MDSKFRVPFTPREQLEEVRTGAGLIVEGTKDLVKTRFITVTEGPAILASGRRVPDFYSIRRGDAVNVIPYFYHMGACRFVLIRKVKTASGIAYYSFPGGMLPVGRDPARHAITELCEETGLVAEELTPLGYVHRSPESCADRDLFYLAMIDSLDGLRCDPEEGITTSPVYLTDLLRLVIGQYFDPYHAVALWRAIPHIERVVGTYVLTENLREASRNQMDTRNY